MSANDTKQIIVSAAPPNADAVQQNAIKWLEPGRKTSLRSSKKIGTKPQPAPRHFAVVPSGDDIRTRTKHPMEVVEKDRKAKQVDPKNSGKLVKVLFDPNLSVIEILPEKVHASGGEIDQSVPIIFRPILMPRFP